MTGLERDPAMLPLVADSGAGVCVMHAQGPPRTMQDRPTYNDVLAEVLDYLRRRRNALLAVGVRQDRIALDPGIGFGKTAGHNLQLLSHARQFHTLGCPLLFGHSRKRFSGDCPDFCVSKNGTAPFHDTSLAEDARDERGVGREESGDGRETRGEGREVAARPVIALLPGERTAGTIGVALALARQGVQILRVHDVAAVRQALFFFRASGGMDDVI